MEITEEKNEKKGEKKKKRKKKKKDELATKCRETVRRGQPKVMRNELVTRKTLHAFLYAVLVGTGTH